MNRNWWGGTALCQRGVCSSHCPLRDMYIQCTHMLTPSLKPISSAQGMGTPQISSHPLPHIIPVLSLTLPPLILSPSISFPLFLPHSITSSHCPALALSLSLVPPFPLSRSSCPAPVLLFSQRLLLLHRFYFLPPSVPNLSRARSVFFPDNLFLIPQN